MKVIYNNILPFKGFVAINIFGILFIRKSYKKYEGTYWYDAMLNHEKIHTAQMKEQLYIFFYVLYLIEYIIRLFATKFNFHTAYKSISFEQEAYTNENNLTYLNNRKRFSWLKYIKLK